MRRGARPRPAGEAGVKVDARSERWREHRKKVRAEIVDAAFRAIDRLGPNVSVREIAEEAGTAKPKIYRHFVDKSDMFAQIGERMRDMLWAAIIPSINVETDSAREIVGRGVQHYVDLVDQHPNVVRFLLQGRFADQSAAAMTTVNKGRDITLAVADIISSELEDMALDPAAFELAAFAIFGTAASATDWWLGADDDSPRRMPAEAFIAHMTTIMMGAINGTAELLGVKIDVNEPLHTAVRQQPVA
ncbi:TetR/AcrR family transcriptional regulator [Mycolicibacterium holsaticum]|uniref:TetR/AcrR family transcriptional regulator n=1 Tax=Mycolicibacterium holsaticum TaxID=152142 RepID=UPI001C7CE05B|nr:TetR/AcrR family transcriptional regulator [Mycolicibacterium holsaticum]QZA11055.1 TetR/AcrR family transcriptional regulator [Mycolicibacterium holsaticum DSM 44478 = JCM 12374]UNC11450.1 TetR/AcrR family transcriptional regulator [Mycolicibacterium holsaticum DSM 44478 = JCM 12374]